MCVDRFEVSLSDQASGETLSPYYPVRKEYDGFLRERKGEAKKLSATVDAGADAVLDYPALSELQRGGHFVAQARSVPNVFPSGYLSRDTARAACEVAGKRLCRRSEWRTACRGEMGNKYPYGNKYERVQCNLGRGMHPSRILFGKPSASVIDPRLNLQTLDGEPLLRKTGATPTCKSPWGKDAVYDMVGNLDEWVDDDKGVFLGAAYTRYTKAGCDAAVDAHPAGYWDYSTGARCCKDPAIADSGAPTGESGAAPTTARADLEKRVKRLFSDDKAAAARRQLREALAATPWDETLNKLYDESLWRDPGFASKGRELGLESEIDAIKYLGGGSTITLRLLREGAPLYAFKPDQTRGASDYTSEIASWRLCELLRCAFYVPKNEPVRLEKGVFDALYARVSGEAQDTYARRNFRDLVWRDLDGRQYLHGAAEDWVPHLVELPVEHEDVWRPWLAQPPAGVALSRLGFAAIDAFSVKQARNSAIHRKHMERELRGMRAGELARQLSQLFAFDFLIGNWDRMSEKAEFYGANCHVAEGRVVSIDNGATFREGVHPKLEARLEAVQRFSASFIDRIRGLDQDSTLRRLYPDADARQRRRFFVFWKQRTLLLEHVAKLERRYGTREVLCWD